MAMVTHYTELFGVVKMFFDFLPPALCRASMVRNIREFSGIATIIFFFKINHLQHPTL